MPRRQHGKGLFDKLWGSEFPGERHMLLKVGNKLKRAQYAGPALDFFWVLSQSWDNFNIVPTLSVGVATMLSQWYILGIAIT